MFIDTKEGSESRRSVISPDPTLKSLAYVLRHKELWPEGFSWDFRYSTTCAIGLGHRLWPGDYSLRATYNLSEEQVARIFTKPSFFGMKWVSPETVAKRIERHLRRIA